MTPNPWKERNRDRVREYARQYRSRNRSAINAYMRQWRKTPKAKAIKKRWDEANRDHIRSYHRDRLEKIRSWFREYKRTLKCQRCPESHPACLDFHHIDPSLKDGRVGQLARRSKQRAMEEISKCMVLCANCHRKEHHGR